MEDHANAKRQAGHIEREARDKVEQEAREKAEKERQKQDERERLEKQKRYQEWLASIGYDEKEKTNWRFEDDGRTVSAFLFKSEFDK